jgi:tRNA nucleotidyltransferase (CCA-adding enzyme)
MKDPLFDELQLVYSQAGYDLYIVGGTSRDLLLGRSFSDRDYATNATPEEEKHFLQDANYAFARYGSIRLLFKGQEIDVTTLRKEMDYRDFRHPGKVTFVQKPSEDYFRRDFTINALYLTSDYQVLDFCGGQQDLHDKIIRFIGDPSRRVQEDPLRIIRAERFAELLSFTIEEKTQKAIDEFRPLLSELNPAKIKEEERKGWKRIK